MRREIHSFDFWINTNITIYCGPVTHWAQQQMNNNTPVKMVFFELIFLIDLYDELKHFMGNLVLLKRITWISVWQQINICIFFSVAVSRKQLCFVLIVFFCTIFESVPSKKKKKKISCLWVGRIFILVDLLTYTFTPNKILQPHEQE